MSSFFSDVVPEMVVLRLAAANGEGVGSGREGEPVGEVNGTLWVLACPMWFPGGDPIGLLVVLAVVGRGVSRGLSLVGL